jgi:hypothetical protein
LPSNSGNASGEPSCERGSKNESRTTSCDQENRAGKKRQIVGSGGPWLQCATYPQSPLSGPPLLLRRHGPVPGILAARRPGGDYG